VRNGVMDAVHVGRTTIQRRNLSKPSGTRAFAWLNMAVAFSRTFEEKDASAGGDRCHGGHLIPVDIEFRLDGIAFLS